LVTLKTQTTTRMEEFYIEDLVRGEKGDQGLTGRQGPPGEKGEKGDKGDPGKDGKSIEGPAGKDSTVPGPAGKDGKDGKDGAEGKVSPKGPMGIRGEKGDRGNMGLDGLPGKDGKDGKEGKTGPKGDKGERGETGLTGPKGDKGDKGEKGDRPIAGIDYTIRSGPRGPAGDTTKLVPYVGAATNVNLGVYGITAATGSFGTSPNVSSFGADGVLVMEGEATLWNDSMVPAANFRTGGTALTFIDCGNGIFLHRFDVGDIFYVQIQFPHEMKLNTTVYPHLHLMCNTAIGATGYNVEVTTSQSWTNINSAFPVPTIVSTGQIVSFQNSAQYKHVIMPLSPVIPTVNQGDISSFIMYKVERITSSVQPLSPANSLFILGMDIHYEIDTMGSREEFIK
jgi:hypothetical protein